MTEPKFDAAVGPTGCFIDGHHGWNVHWMAVDLAVENGMQLGPVDAHMLWRYKNDNDDPTGEVADYMLNQGGLTDGATEYLDSVTVNGCWEWIEGELFLTYDPGEANLPPDPDDDDVALMADEVKVFRLLAAEKGLDDETVKEVIDYAQGKGKLFEEARAAYEAQFGVSPDTPETLAVIALIDEATDEELGFEDEVGGTE